MEEVIKSLNEQELKDVLQGLDVQDVRPVRNTARGRVNKALGPRANLGISLVHFFYDLEEALSVPGDTLDIQVNDLNLYVVEGLGWFRMVPGNRCASMKRDIVRDSVFKALSKTHNRVFVSVRVSREDPSLANVNKALLSLSQDLGLRYAPTKNSHHTYTSDIKDLGSFMLTVHVHMEEDDLETFAYDVTGS